MPGLALALLLAAADAEPRVLQGEQALEGLDFRAAATAFERACLEASCTRAQFLRATTGLATALSSLAQTQRAAEAFKLVLFISPGWALPSGASPRLREPFEAAQVFWRSRAAPELSFKPVALGANAAASLTAQLVADPLGVVDRLVVVARRPEREAELTASGRTPLNDGGFAEGFALPAELTAPGELTLVAQALSKSGSVLLESTLERTISGAGPEPAAPPAAVDAPPPASGRALLHASVTAVFDVVSRQLGVEALASFSVLRVLDVAAGATFGANVGLRVAATLHLPRTYRVSPFAQARFGLHPSAGPAVGGGLAAGVTVEAGPGRVTASFAGEAFSAAPQFAVFGALFLIGYELDVPGLRGAD